MKYIQCTNTDVGGNSDNDHKKMEKVRQFIKRDYSPLRLYKDDIKEINDILLEHSNKVTFETDKYKYDNIDEFLKQEDNKILVRLKINSNSPSIEIWFHHMWTNLTSYNDDTISQGLVNKIDNVLRPRELSLPFLFKSSFLFTSLIVYYILTWLFKVQIPELIKGLFFAIILVIGGLSAWINLKRHSIIKIINESDENNFWTRNKDQIILLIFGALIGSGLTLLIEYLKDIK